MDIIPIEYEEDYKKILDYINAYKNGVTSDAMQSYGINYKKNFGVSMVDLRRIAERYSANHQLAQLLWNKGWRETYILSTLIDEAQRHNAHTLQKSVDSAPTFEALEQLAYNLAWQLDDLDHYFSTMADIGKNEVQYFLIKVTTYQLMNKKIEAAEAWQRISQYSFTDQAAILNTLQNLLLRITAQENNLHQEVIDYCAVCTSESWLMLTDVIKEYGVL